MKNNEKEVGNMIILRSSFRFKPMIGTELRTEWNTVDILTETTISDWNNVEEEDKCDEESKE